MKMSNQKLKKYLRQFGLAEHRILNSLYMKCFDLTKGNESVTTEMMEKLEKKAYVQLEFLDVTQYKYITKQEKIFSEVEKNLEELFTTSNSFSDQKPLINNNKMSLLSESNNEKLIFSGNNMTIKPSKVQGIEKSKGVCEAVSSTWISDVLTVSNENTQILTSQSKIQKFHNNCFQNEIIELPRLNYSESIDLNIDENLHCGNLSNQLLVPTNSKTISKMVSVNEKKNKDVKNVSNISSNKNNNSPHSASAVNKIKSNNIVKCRKDSRETTSKIDIINKNEKKTEKLLSNDRLNVKKNSLHRTSADIECINKVKRRKDYQKNTSKMDKINEKKKETENLISYNSLKKKEHSAHRASVDNKCNNMVKYLKDSQKITSSKIDTIYETEKNTEKLISNNRLKKKKNSSHRVSVDNKCNNMVKYLKDSQKTTSSKIDTINEKEKLISNDRLKMKNISPHRASADLKCKRLKRKQKSPHRYFSTSKYNDIINNNKDSQKCHLPKFIEESSINKHIVLEQVTKKKSSKVQTLCSVENSTDLKKNQSFNTKSIVSSPHSSIINMNFAPGMTYEKLRIIIFKNFSFYNQNGLYKLAKIFTNNDLLLKSRERWHSDTVQLIETLLKDLFKLLNHLQFKNVVFMACLSILFRRIYFSSKSEEMYRHFIVFFNVIETLVMSVDDCFWKPLLPDGWNKVFFNGCTLVDFILYGAMPNSMYLHVDCDPKQNVKVLYNAFLNEVQSQNVLNSASSKPKQLAIESSVIDSSSDSSILKMIMDNDKNSDILFLGSSSKTIATPIDDNLDSVSHQLERPDATKNVSVSCISLCKTSTSTQINKINKKRKHSVLQTNINNKVVKKNPSHYIIKQLNVQNLCLQSPKYSQSINRPKQHNDPHSRTLLNEEIQNELNYHYPLQIIQSGSIQNIQLSPNISDAKNSHLP